MADDPMPLSFNHQIRTLRKGECLAKTKRFEIGRASASDIADSLKRLRVTVNAAVSRIRESSGNNFRVESGSFVTNDNEAILAVVNVTRI